MEKKNLTLIIIVLVIVAVVGLLVAFDVFQKEGEEIEESKMINGTLSEVGDNYFVIERNIPKENQEMLNPEEMEYTKEYIKVNVNSSTEIFDLSDIKHITVPGDILNGAHGQRASFNNLRDKING